MEASWIGPVTGALAGVSLGFVLTKVDQHARERQSRPVLKIDCDDAPRRTGENADAIWMKFRVQNTRKYTVARNCRAYLIGIHEVTGGVRRGGDLKPDSVQLTWEGGDFEPRDISHGHSQYGDIVHFPKDDEGWRFWTKPNVIIDRNPKIKEYRGVYEFTILVSGDGVDPEIGTVNVEYFGKWDQAKVYDSRSRRQSGTRTEAVGYSHARS